VDSDSFFATGVHVRGDFESGTFKTGNFSSGGSVSIFSGSLIGGPVSVAKTIYVGSVLSVADKVISKTSLSSSAGTSFSSSLSLADNLFSHQVSIQDHGKLAGHVSIGKDCVSSGKLQVQGNSTVNSSATVREDFYAARNVSLGSNVAVDGSFYGSSSALIQYDAAIQRSLSVSNKTFVGRTTSTILPLLTTTAYTL
jgi:predicted acyltransferase (DUF342 family)